MSRVRSSKMEQIRAWIDTELADGYPQELAEMFLQLKAVFDNADRLVGLFGVVDEGSAAEAQQLYETYKMAKAEQRRRTLH